MTWRIGIDIGGTFTDLVATNSADGRTIAAKVLSTPRHLVKGVLNVLEIAGLDLHDASGMVHGSTIAINAITQQNGARTALLTTKGFRDVLEMGRKSRPDMYNLFFRPRLCLVPRTLRFEVDERLDSSGSELRALNMDEIARLVESLPRDIEAMAISYLHSYANDSHEQRTANFLREKYPDLYVTPSADISGEFGEYERTSTAVANAYVGPLVARYIDELQTEVAARGLGTSLLITQSNGGVMSASAAIRQPIRTTESGPAAGVNGAAWIGRSLGISDLIAFDMGGTTAKACVITDGEPDMSAEYYVGGRLTGIPVQVPFLDVIEVGAGGGSIAYIDESGGLRVGPRSAGAAPGPACYGLGGIDATVTDANVVVGKIAPESFLGGKMKLDSDAAFKAVGNLAADLEIDIEECANGVLRVANEIMAAAIHAVTVERGRDPRDFTLVTYGGAGPVHALALARELEIPTVLIPASPGTFAAFGMLVTNLRHDVSRTLVGRLDRLDKGDVERLFEELEAEARGVVNELAGTIGTSTITLRRRLDLRYLGQFHPLTLNVPEGNFAAVAQRLPELFHRDHHIRYGHSAPEELIEVIAAHVTAMRKVEVSNVLDNEGNGSLGSLTTRNVLFEDGRWRACAVLDRIGLRPGETVSGPAIIEDLTTNIVLTDGSTATSTPEGHLLVNVDRGTR